MRVGDTAKTFIGNGLRKDCGMIFANQCWTYFEFEIRFAALARRKKQIGELHQLRCRRIRRI